MNFVSKYKKYDTIHLKSVKGVNNDPKTAIFL